MKKLIIAVLFCAMSGAIPAQTPSIPIEDTANGTIRSAHYIITGGGEDAQAVAGDMEARYAIYNRLFRFDSDPADTAPAGTASAGKAADSMPGSISDAPLNVRVFYDSAAYADYVNSRLAPDGGNTEASGSGAIYLHYNDVDRRELVIDRSASGENNALPYQAFIQFLRAFVANPPAWMREGFAAYFGSLRDTGGKLAYEENLDWLETVKEMDILPPVELVLAADDSKLPENFPALAWSVASFFCNSGNSEYTRAINDSFMLVSGKLTAQENTDAIMRRITRWNDMSVLNADYRNYLDSRKTFSWLMDEGMRAWSAHNYTDAQLAFLSARNQKPSHFAPWYYLGLLAYEEKNYETAEQYYLSSLKLGADPALTAYALGLNAAGAGKTADAKKYLSEAARIAPERFSEKVGNILSKINQ
ncbi:MAG: tetratricopeptide repeat protein [Treponema sp.]|nr:tetratricopeptide repeat protein [Treponema sp.]